MLIGNQYSDNKLYRGIKHYDHLPLTSEDLHEQSDTLQMKNSYLLNNILGSGVLNAPTVERVGESNAGHIYIKLSEPAVLLLDGDISLVQFSSTEIGTTLDLIKEAYDIDAVLYILGWYQHVTSHSTLREYGGLANNVLPNDLQREPLDIQVSTRYQFRWIAQGSSDFTTGKSSVFLNLNATSEDNVSYTIPVSSGPTSESLKFDRESGGIFRAPKPDSIDFIESDLYLIPLASYKYTAATGKLIYAKTYPPIKPGNVFLKSETEPTGTYIDGTIWFNPSTREFKTYVTDVGFVDSASKMGFLQYQSVATISEDNVTLVPIGIEELTEGDSLQVYYEGLLLAKGTHYDINYGTNEITLKFATNKDDTLTFTAIKIVEATDINNISATFLAHMSSKGSGSHVELSDSTEDSTSGVNSGKAATPKAVYESKLIHDQSKGTRYKLGVENGLLYIEEV